MYNSYFPPSNWWRYLDDNDGDNQFKYGIIVLLVSFLVSYNFYKWVYILAVLFGEYVYENNSMLLIKYNFVIMLLYQYLLN